MKSGKGLQNQGPDKYLLPFFLFPEDNGLPEVFFQAAIFQVWCQIFNLITGQSSYNSKGSTLLKSSIKLC